MSSLFARILTLRRRELLTHVKAGIETRDFGAISRAMRRHRYLIGGSVVSSTLERIIVGRCDDSLDHASASATLEELAESCATLSDPEAWFLIESLAQAVGCFLAGSVFGERGIDALSASPIPEKRFLGALHLRDLDAARETFQATGTRESAFWVDAGHYLWVWSRGAAGIASWSGDQAWLDVVSGRQVVIVGPAPSAATPIKAEQLVARVIAPGVVTWPADDVAGGRCDLAYSNSKSTKWFISHNQVSSLEGFSFTSFRTDSGHTLGLPHGRTAYHHKQLLPMPWDRTNMVPVAAWDLLHVPEIDLSITGSNFFASRTAYTANDVRFDAERGTSTDQSGSTGLIFERCVSFSHHNIGAHLNFMANLAQAGALQFDTEGTSVLALSYRDYLAEIDELYGLGKV